MMSDADKDVLELHRPMLLDNIGLEDGVLLAHLRSRGAISPRQEDEIKSEKGNPRQVGDLLDNLRRGDSNTMDKFVYSLRDSGQAGVASQWLRPPEKPDSWANDQSVAEDSSSFLCRKDADILERCRPHLMTTLTLKDGHLLSSLRAREVITGPQENLIKSESGDSNGVGLLVNFLLRSSSAAVDEFIHALNATGSSGLVDQWLREPNAPDTHDRQPVVGIGSSTEELRCALRENLADQLERWKTSLEECVSHNGGNLTYIDQPCAVKTDGSNQLVDVSSAVQLVEGSSHGDRTLVYGDGGMGKTTFLKHLAHSWLEENSVLARKFSFVFLVLMRLVRSHCLLDVICNDLELLPTECKQRLKESMTLHSRRILILLDSYEELSFETEEIDKLIIGDKFAKFTVIVTSRPGSRLTQLESRMKSFKKATLKDLPEESVNRSIREHFDGDGTLAHRALRSFPAMTFLQKPINLALFLYVVSLHGAKIVFDFTQPEVFNQVLQFTMLTYAKKKKLPDFVPCSGSYLKNKDIPLEIRLLFKEIAQKCYEERRANSLVLHIQDGDVFSQEDFIYFGLFTKGSEPNLVYLPHLLFQEYFAAIHLVGSLAARNALLGELEQKFKSTFVKPPFPEIVRSLGLENIVRFMVALSPEIIERLGGLFMLQKRRIVRDSGNYHLVRFGYYADLLNGCSGASASALAVALASAPVDVQKNLQHVSFYKDSESFRLLPHLSYDQCASFLYKVYNVSMWEKDGQGALAHRKRKKLYIVDSFVLAAVFRYSCIVKSDRMRIIKCAFPARMLSENLCDVVELFLDQCELLNDVPESMSGFDQPSPIEQARCSSVLQSIWLHKVRGIEHLSKFGVITEQDCGLVFEGCSDSAIRDLRVCFPNAASLALKHTIVLFETREDLAWLATRIDQGGHLSLAPVGGGEVPSLCYLLGKFQQIERMSPIGCVSVLNPSDVSMENSSVKVVELKKCEGVVDLSTFLEVCNQCPKLAVAVVQDCKVNTRCISDAFVQNTSLTELHVNDCTENMYVEQLFQACSGCLKLETLSIRGCCLQFPEGKTTSSENRISVRNLCLDTCKGGVDVGQLFQVCQCCQQLERIEIARSRLVLTGGESHHRPPRLHMIHVSMPRTEQSIREVMQQLQRLAPWASVSCQF